MKRKIEERERILFSKAKKSASELYFMALNAAQIVACLADYGLDLILIKRLFGKNFNGAFTPGRGYFLNRKVFANGVSEMAFTHAAHHSIYFETV